MSSELSAKMSTWLAHVRAASEQGVSLSKYAAAQGLSAAALYQAKSQLMRKGAWPRSAPATGVRATRSQRSRRASNFVPVVPVQLSAVSCRLSHASGWTLTCDTLPPTEWLNALLTGTAHAA